jgi:hypothetical protein
MHAHTAGIASSNWRSIAADHPTATAPPRRVAGAEMKRAPVAAKRRDLLGGAAAWPLAARASDVLAISMPSRLHDSLRFCTYVTPAQSGASGSPKHSASGGE